MKTVIVFIVPCKAKVFLTSRATIKCSSRTLFPEIKHVLIFRTLPVALDFSENSTFQTLNQFPSTGMHKNGRYNQKRYVLYVKTSVKCPKIITRNTC